MDGTIMDELPSLRIRANELCDLAGERVRGELWWWAQHESVRQALDCADHDARRQAGIVWCSGRVGRERRSCQLDELIFEPVQLSAKGLRELCLLEEDAMQRRSRAVQRDHRVDDAGEHLVKACAGAQSFQVGPQRGGALGEVVACERNEDRVLVGEVLVDGADRYAGSFGDAVRGAGGVAVTLEDLSSRLQDRYDGGL